MPCVWSNYGDSLSPKSHLPSIPFVIFAKQIARTAVTFALTPLSLILPPTPALSVITNIMSEGETTDEMVKRAAHNLIKYPKLGLPYHMRGCEFTKEQSLNRALQMKVRRLADKLRPPPTQQPARSQPQGLCCFDCSWLEWICAEGRDQRDESPFEPPHHEAANSRAPRAHCDGDEGRSSLSCHWRQPHHFG